MVLVVLLFIVVFGEVYGLIVFLFNGDGINDWFILYSDGGFGEIVECF